MNGRFRSILAVILAGSTLASAPLGAQTVGDGGVSPVAGLNLPSSFSTFGKVDPYLRKATAIVNGEIITGTDVDQRLALIVLANGGQISAEETDRLRVQVMRNLIDELLQIQEAKANKIEIEKGEIDQSFNRVAANFKRSPSALDAYLKQSGSSTASMRRQIHGEVAWNRLLRRKVEVNISDAEVDAIVERLKAARGTSEYHVMEIFMTSTPENGAQIEDNGKKIIEQLKKGGSFAAYARQFSEASTAVRGGDLGWIRAGQLPDALAAAVQEISTGQIVGPVAIPGGYSILYLADQRKVGMADARDAVLSLKQIAYAFPAGINDADVKAKVAAFNTVTTTMGGCGGVAAAAAKIGGDVVDRDQITVRDLPPALQDMMLQLQVGQSTPPFGTKEDGVRVLVMCGRDDPVDAGIDANKIRTDIEEDRYNKRAQRYLRDLRRDAVIEYR
jgi:peptidyl-prolyl cis-trans isomerase SurA